MLLNNMILSVIIGSILGSIVVATIQVFQRKDSTIGYLTRQQRGILFAMAVIGIFLVSIKQFPNVLMLVSLLELLWMLLFTSYTDLKCGMVYSFSVYVSLLFQIVCVAIQARLNPKSLSYLPYFVGFVIILVILCLAGLSKADGFIYLCCFCNILILTEAYQSVFMLLLLFFSNIIALLCRIPYFLRKEYTKRFPFTAYICSGYYIVSFLYGISK